jgi:hypothetical protein
MTRVIIERGKSVLAALVIVAAMAAYIGCASSQKADSTKKEEPATGTTPETTTDTTSQGTYGQKSGQGALETAQAADWSAYSNPKPGICPVCQMALERAYIEEVTIAEKKYACCSARCVALLSDSPDQYLTAAASVESQEH